MNIFTEFDHITFPSGEKHLRARFGEISGGAMLEYHSPCPDIMLIGMAAACIREELQNGDVELYLPFVPYARQDRIAQPGDAFSLKVFAGFLNQLNFSKVHICDPHSDVTPALINNVRVTPQWTIASQVPLEEGTKIVAPDLGAAKKATRLASLMSRDLVQASKVRDSKTGALSKFTVLSGSLSGTDCLVVDDICDGGGTFLGLGEVLRDRGVKRLGLYITHGLFTKGLDDLFKVYDYIYTTDSVPQTDSRLNIINV